MKLIDYWFPQCFFNRQLRLLHVLKIWKILRWQCTWFRWTIVHVCRLFWWATIHAFFMSWILDIEITWHVTSTSPSTLQHTWSSLRLHSAITLAQLSRSSRSFVFYLLTSHPRFKFFLLCVAYTVQCCAVLCCSSFLTSIRKSIFFSNIPWQSRIDDVPPDDFFEEASLHWLEVYCVFVYLAL